MTSADALSIGVQPALRSRRWFLESVIPSIGFAAAAAFSSQLQVPPGNVGRKVDRNGTFIPFPGNTIICHLENAHTPDVHAAISQIHNDGIWERLANKVARLPPESYHVTIFGIATSYERLLGTWPSFVPLSGSMEECNQRVGEKLRAFQTGDSPIRLRIDANAKSFLDAPGKLRVAGHDAAELAKIATLRNKLSDTLGVRELGHDKYQLHITFGYQVGWLSAGEKALYAEALKSWYARFTILFPVLELGPPEYCTFADMSSYQRQFFLG